LNGELAAVRRRRAWQALAESGLDALIVGQPRNLAYLTGARRILVRGSRPFAPLAVVVGGGADVWMQSFSEADIPEDLADRLYPQLWNPQRLAERVAGILDAAGATRVGVDSMTPAWRARLGAVLPSADLVPADEVLRGVRKRKTGEELPVLRRAVAVAASAMVAAAPAVSAGATEAEIRARIASAVVTAGANLPSEGVCAVLDEGQPLRRLPADRVIGTGDLVALDVSAVLGGYEGGVGRTLAVDGAGSAVPRPSARWEELRSLVLASCRSGATGADLLAATEHCPRDPDLPLAYGYGFGPEPPVAPDDQLVAGDVLAVQARGWEPASAGWFARDMVLVGDREGELLTGDLPL
jgi:Xaa-Pro dipeptidase